MWLIECLLNACVTDNGNHFVVQVVRNRLSCIGRRRLLIAPRYPQSNNAAEKFAQVLKSAVRSIEARSFEELEADTNNSLMQYRHAVHAMTRNSHRVNNRMLHTNLLGFDAEKVTYFNGNDQQPSKAMFLGRLRQHMYRLSD